MKMIFYAREYWIQDIQCLIRLLKIIVMVQFCKLFHQLDNLCCVLKCFILLRAAFDVFLLKLLVFFLLKQIKIAYNYVIRILFDVYKLYFNRGIFIFVFDGNNSWSIRIHMSTLLMNRIELNSFHSELFRIHKGFPKFDEYSDTFISPAHCVFTPNS